MSQDADPLDPFGGLNPFVPLGECLSHEQNHDPLTHKTVGLARYRITFLHLSRCIGVQIRVVAQPNQPTTYTVDCTKLYVMQDGRMMQELYNPDFGKKR